jgi:4a-hydroxytetrahydrobiopterin dehydratase
MESNFHARQEAPRETGEESQGGRYNFYWGVRLSFRVEVIMSTATAVELTHKHCAPCEGGVPKLAAEQVSGLMEALPNWKLSGDGHRIHREWRVKDFVTALDFFQRVGKIAEEEDHHPDLHLVGYRNVTIEIWTHAVNGLTENDFILAAKIDKLGVELKK